MKDYSYLIGAGGIKQDGMCGDMCENVSLSTNP